ncbi:FAD-binding domain-containing protein [Marasmius fiardii PR-910]|nr:FAD-binding domain-containing protein [Marasmius fiardii PR-910]
MSDLQSLGFKGQVLTSSSPGYDSARDRFPKNAVLKPSYIVQPSSVQDIPLAIKFALSQNPPLELAIKGGGVSPHAASSSDGGLVIDLSNLKTVKVADDKQSVSVGGGAVWGDVYAETDKHGVVPVGGNVHFLGVGGVTLGGGYSHLSGKFGLGVDNILQATVVLADGRIVTTNEKEEPDLFWAIRGGVNQFGVVAELVLKTYPLAGPTTVGAIGYPGTALNDVLAALHKHLDKQHPSTKMILMFARAPPHFYPGLLLLPYIENENTKPEEVLAPFREPVKPLFEGLAEVQGFSAVSHGADQVLDGGPPRMVIDGALFKDLWDDVIGEAFGRWCQFTEVEEFKGSLMMWEFGHRDKLTERKVEDMAFAARDPHYYVAVIPRYINASADAEAAEWASGITNLVRNAQVQKAGKPLITPASFALNPQTVPPEKIWGSNLPKLRKLKAKYDPKKVWTKGWFIEP